MVSEVYLLGWLICEAAHRLYPVCTIYTTPTEDYIMINLTINLFGIFLKTIFFFSAIWKGLTLHKARATLYRVSAQITKRGPGLYFFVFFQGNSGEQRAVQVPPFSCHHGRSDVGVWGKHPQRHTAEPWCKVLLHWLHGLRHRYCHFSQRLKGVVGCVCRIGNLKCSAVKFRMNQCRLLLTWGVGWG